MFKDLFSDASWLTLPVISMLLFIAIFVAVVVWVFRRPRAAHYRHMSHLPLERDDGGVTVEAKEER